MDTQALFEFLSKLIDALTAVVKWFSGSSLKVKLLTGIISAVSVLSAIVFWSHDIYSEALRGKIWAWYAASTASETINLSASEQEVVDRQSATLERDIGADLPNFFKHAVVAADLQQKYTPWTLAEVCSALFLDREGIALMASHRADILEFQRLPYRQDPGCDCWRQNDRTEASPQHILVTAWVIYSLELNKIAPTAGEIRFLQENQEANGGWNMFKVPKLDDSQLRPTGSSFSSAWVLLALDEVLRDETINNPALKADLRGRAENLVKFFLNRPDARDSQFGLWSLYPGWEHERVSSRGTSGLVLFALHRHMLRSEEGREGIYKKDLEAADRAFLRSLPGSKEEMLPLWHADSHERVIAYIKTLSHQPVGKKEARDPQPTASSQSDDAKSYSLPWMIIGAQVAYHSGTYAERVRAQQFIELAVGSLDSDLKNSLLQDVFEGPEILMASRYLRNPELISQ